MRPVGYGSFSTPLWQGMLDTLDAGFTEAAVEVRHPYLDLRVLRFMLAVPTLPWCRRKYLVRRAMQNALPREVLTRKKSPVMGDPVSIAGREVAMGPLDATPELLKYVDPAKIAAAMPEGVEGFWQNLIPRVLNQWLRYGNTCAKISHAELNDDFERQHT